MRRYTKEQQERARWLYSEGYANKNIARMVGIPVHAVSQYAELVRLGRYRRKSKPPRLPPDIEERDSDLMRLACIKVGEGLWGEIMIPESRMEKKTKNLS